MGVPVGTDRRIGNQLVPLLAAILAFVVAACSGSAAASPARPGGEGAFPAASAAPAAPGGATGGGATSGATGGGTTGGGGGQALVDDTKIVRTGSLQLTVTDTDRAVAAARDAIRGLGGYIGASQQQRSDDRIIATVTYRIPVARWEDRRSGLPPVGPGGSIPPVSPGEA